MYGSHVTAWPQWVWGYDKPTEKWQSSSRLKYFIKLGDLPSRFDSPSHSVSLQFWQNAIADFCSDDFAV